MNKIGHYKLIFLLAINAVLFGIGIFWVYHVNIWTDENWYYHSAVLFSNNYLPYIDFFYHRLPLNVEFYGLLFKLFGSSFITARFISLFLFMALVNLTSATVYKICNDFKMVILSYLAMICPAALFGYLTVATFSLSALLIVLSAFVLTTGLNKNIKLFLFIFLNFLIYANRYLVDYQLIFLSILLISLVIYYHRDKLALLSITLSSTIGCLYIFKYFIFYGDKNIFFNTVTFNFSLKGYLRESGVTLPAGLKENLIQFINLRFFEFDSFYPINVICIVGILVLAITFLKNRMKIKDIIVSPRLLTLHYLTLVVLLNFGFYYISLLDWPTSKLYVFPVMSIIGIWLISEIFKQISQHQDTMPEKAIFLLFLTLFLTQGMASSKEYTNLRYLDSDLASLEKVSHSVRNATGGTNGMILTFTPLLAHSGIISDPRLNMEMFAFRPNLTHEEVLKYHLMDAKLMISEIESKKYAAIVLSEKRFFGNSHMSKEILPFRPSIMKAISQGYNLKEIIPLENFRGDFSIFVPK